MARIRRKISYSDTRAELAEAKAIRRGAGEDEFWDEDELVDYQPSRNKKKKRKRKAGCPGNDGNQHVYVWISRKEYLKLYGWGNTTYFYSSRYQYKICCGCLKRASGRSFRVAP